MGSPISGFLAEFKLKPLGNMILNELDPKQSLHGLRYVKDIFTLWEHGRSELSDILSAIKDIVKNIIFTLEIGESSVLPFSDVLVTKEDLGLQTTLPTGSVAEFCRFVIGIYFILFYSNIVCWRYFLRFPRKQR